MKSNDHGLFERQTYKRKSGELATRYVIKNQMWFYPPEPPAVADNNVPEVGAFFRNKVFFWRPVGVWNYGLKCPRDNCPGKNDPNVFLYRCGYSHTVRYICDISGWYLMLTELLACGLCTKASKESKDHHLGRFPAWSWAILSQLTPAHQALFPAVLTLRYF